MLRTIKSRGRRECLDPPSPSSGRDRSRKRRDRNCSRIRVCLARRSVAELTLPLFGKLNSIDWDRMLLAVTGERIRRVECSHRDTWASIRDTRRYRNALRVGIRISDEPADGAKDPPNGRGCGGAVAGISEQRYVPGIEFPCLETCYLEFSLTRHLKHFFIAVFELRWKSVVLEIFCIITSIFDHQPPSSVQDRRYASALAFVETVRRLTSN